MVEFNYYIKFKEIESIKVRLPQLECPLVVV